MWRLSGDPASTVAFDLGYFSVRWYGLLYGLAFIVIWWLASLDNRKRQVFESDVLEDCLLLGFLGAVVGGRIGYVLWYGMAFWQRDLWFPLKVWEGGMSFHGGLIGALVTVVWISRYYRVPLLKLTDFLAPLAPIGLFLGRIGNFINQELYGRVTDVDWAVCFPLVDNFYRHPSQLYEALCEGVLLWIVLNVCRKYFRIRGQLTGVFLWGYGFLRIMCELFREPDWQIGYLWCNLTLGELLSLPMIVLGSCLLWRSCGVTE